MTLIEGGRTSVSCWWRTGPVRYSRAGRVGIFEIGWLRLVWSCGQWRISWAEP